MKYWLRHPKKPGYLGPMTLAEIRSGLESGLLNWKFEIVAASGQSLPELNKCRIWQPMKTICDPESVELPETRESWPPSVPYQTPAEEFLSEIRVATAYSGVRRGIEIIQTFLTYGLLILLALSAVMNEKSEGWFLGFLTLLIGCAVILCVFYLIKHALLALLDIADLLVHGSRKP